MEGKPFIASLLLIIVAGGCGAEDGESSMLLSNMLSWKSRCWSSVESFNQLLKSFVSAKFKIKFHA